VVEAALSLSSWRSRFEPRAIVLVMRPSCFGGPVVVNAAASLLSQGCHFEPGAVVFETTSSSSGQGRCLEVRDVACRVGASSTGQVCHLQGEDTVLEARPSFSRQGRCLESGVVVLVAGATSWRWVRYLEFRAVNDLPGPLPHTFEPFPLSLLPIVLPEGTSWVEVSA
jgi:hypothetical protein